MKIQYASDLHLEFAENRGLLEQGGGIVPAVSMDHPAGDERFQAWRAEWGALHGE